MRSAERRGNLHIGTADFSFNAGVSQAYNDNIGLSKANPLDDFITSPFVGMNMNWPITQLNALTLGFGLSYDKYWKHPQFNTNNILVAPTSAMKFDFYVKDIHFNLHDQIAVEQDPVAFSQLSNVATFRRITNVSGIGADWDLNRVKLAAGYDHEIFQAVDSTFNFLNHTTDTGMASAGWQIDAPWLVGALVNYAHNAYDTSFQNGSDSYSVQGFANWIVTEHIQVHGQVGYQISSYARGGGVGDNNDFHSVIGSGTVQHQINEFLTHTLSLNDTTQLGIGTNYRELKEIDYKLTSQMIRKTTATFDIFYEWFNDSAGISAEKGSQYGLGILFEYELIKDSRTGLGYQRTQKDSNIALNGYEQNRVYFNFAHDF